MISTTIGACRHYVALVRTQQYSADGDGGFLDVQLPLTPAHWYCSIEAIGANREKLTAATTVESSATHVLRGRFHPQIDTTTRVLFGSRRLDVQSVQDTDQRQQEMTVLATEIVDRGADSTGYRRPGRS